MLNINISIWGRDLKLNNLYKTGYDASRALVIGINKYQKAPPLSYAVSDAEAIKEVLTDKLGFEAKHITYLTDEAATKDNILKEFHSFTTDDVSVDDRVLVFFAGHGYTFSGIRGEVGFLVPYDANTDDTSTLIRWDELTRNSELIRAKHILFIMDACYGGLAVNRDLNPSSSRFLNDMYRRLSRQVLTAGKANEVVADSGGPIPNHSIFTGHLIQGIEGRAANELGVITAKGLMGYVYNKVSNDANSEQTPHYGQFDGDGDFIIVAPEVRTKSDEPGIGIDELIIVPGVSEARDTESLEDKVGYVKELLASEQSRIDLYDFISAELRRFILDTNENNFSSNVGFSNEELLSRIASYEEYAKSLCAIAAVISYWHTGAVNNNLAKILARACERPMLSESGNSAWLSMRWYPLLLLFYQAGVAAVEGKNYASLQTLFYAEVGRPDFGETDCSFVKRISGFIIELNQNGLFKRIPGHEHHYTPVSEYIFKQVQPVLEDLFFFGKAYETAFDEFEVLFAIAVADNRLQDNRTAWGPVGRFGWKLRNGDHSPYEKVLTDAKKLQEFWGPIQAGMFGGSYNRFEEAATQYNTQIQGLNWF